MSDPDELMGRRESADIDEIPDLAMTAEGRVIDEDHIVADDTVVANMRIRHEESALAHARLAAALDGADVHGHAFANDAALADLERRRLAAVADILRRRSERREWKYRTAAAERGVAGDVNMGMQRAARTDRHVRPHNAVRPDRDIVADDGSILYSRRWIDLTH